MIAAQGWCKGQLDKHAAWRCGQILTMAVVVAAEPAVGSDGGECSSGDDSGAIHDMAAFVWHRRVALLSADVLLTHTYCGMHNLHAACCTVLLCSNSCLE